MFGDYIDFLKGLVLYLPFNIFDYVLFASFALYVMEDISFGIIPSAISLGSTILSFFIGLVLYPSVSKILVQNLSFPKGIADAAAFLATASVSFIIVSFAGSHLRKKYIKLTFPKNLDRLGGAILGSFSFFFIGSFIVSLLLSFPTSGVVKDSIRNSVTGKFLSQRTQGIDLYVRKIFGGAIEETINFLTIKPGSNESVELHFKTSSYKVDAKSERAMLALVNIERRKANFDTLSFDESLTQVARKHAKDMLARGYFSHYTPEGFSPFDRMEERNISYQYAGENLAFAPVVEIAMDGLMKSPGHRENILSPNFRRAGIGILDAGIYGKIFVQEFAD